MSESTPLEPKPASPPRPKHHIKKWLKPTAKLVLVLLILTGCFFAAKKYVEITTPWHLCVQKQVSFTTQDAAVADVMKKFNVPDTSLPNISVAKGPYDDFRFVNSTTVAYGTNDCSMWQRNYLSSADWPQVWFGFGWLVCFIYLLVYSVRTDHENSRLKKTIRKLQG